MELGKTYQYKRCFANSPVFKCVGFTNKGNAVVENLCEDNKEEIIPKKSFEDLKLVHLWTVYRAISNKGVVSHSYVTIPGFSDKLGYIEYLRLGEQVISAKFLTQDTMEK